MTWTWEGLATTRAFWALVVGFRVWNALFVRTAFNPDEFWQSTEVAHRMVFGYGHLTWEWQSDAKIRGFAHPGLFVLLYKALALLNLDSRWAVAYGPRILQGLLSALNDYFLYRLACVYFDRRSAKWALLCNLFSWFIFYAMVRPFSNSIETVCTTGALAYWPWKFLEGESSKKENVDPMKKSNRVLALTLAALGVLFRPTNAIIWVYPGLLHLIQAHDRTNLVLFNVLPIAIATLAAMLVIDRWGYGEWTFVPYNFVKFNVLEGKDKLYGTQPWNWYVAQGFPAIIGSALPLAMAGFLTVPGLKKDLGHIIIWALFLYSNAAHKEFRFVLPLLPPALVYAGYCIRNLENKLYVQFRERTQSNLLRLAVFTVVVPNIAAAYYLSRWHQRAPVEVMDFLHQRIQENPSTSIHFWTPCHATPYYSYLHQNVSMWFPDCSPAGRELPEGSESQRLERDPVAFLSSKYHFSASSSQDATHEKLPEYVVMYSPTAKTIDDLLDRAHYLEV
uniref:Mannosyltransferase n=1 Tax=Globisporangium ultimum (strain ATCC 200006 / CBS 805.95 / DAOM BR144) TaxID=431595 RepID=K3W7V1_GLOUD